MPELHPTKCLAAACAQSSKQLMRRVQADQGGEWPGHGPVQGVQYKCQGTVKTASAALTLVCDGMYSSLRRYVKFLPLSRSQGQRHDAISQLLAGQDHLLGVLPLPILSPGLQPQWPMSDQGSSGCMLSHASACHHTVHCLHSCQLDSGYAKRWFGERKPPGAQVFAKCPSPLGTEPYPPPSAAKS